MLLICGTMLTLFSSCRKCNGNSPVFTEEEKAWMTTTGEEGDSILFRSNKGKERWFSIEQKWIEKRVPHNGKSLEKDCPEDETWHGTYKLQAIMSSQYHYAPTLEINMTKTSWPHYSKVFYWSEFTSQMSFGEFDESLDSMRIAGKMYYQVQVVTRDTTIQYAPDRYPTHKLYYNTTYGLLRYDNAKQEVWERVR
ncbi:MAG: hypothetical protein LPJ89_09240 [Hymenobacteraceae bacterium]|nr:hypothetical protein [Hymenobacteraceae bacterium]MDX5395762.1 hypothetical protein [Hymenobacteraceae bacterium]MDX5443949.1 hypothetical protein [Hymenobacteraceae bacterium]MDX5511817.1 hypothetical protein [Hymenobacteraceae bacterium]